MAAEHNERVPILLSVLNQDIVLATTGNIILGSTYTVQAFQMGAPRKKVWFITLEFKKKRAGRPGFRPPLKCNDQTKIRNLTTSTVPAIKKGNNSVSCAKSVSGY